MDNVIISYDLSNCDKEPIHLIGKIQDVGYLIAIKKSDFKVAFVSQNIYPIFKKAVEELFNKPLSNFFDEEFIKAVEEFVISKKTHYTHNKLILQNNVRYQIFFSDSIDYVNIELQKIDNINDYYNSVSDGFKFIDDSMNTLSMYDDEMDLSKYACILLRKYTGFDRVMIYKFDKNNDGEVIGEDKQIGIKSYLGLKFPASDIPKQARELYLKNKVRAIKDANNDGVDLISNSLDIDPQTLDLSYSIFRSVSPVHLQYLRNMKVTASQSISLIINNRLWGLILCHHYNEPKFLAINQRLNTQIFGDLLSNRISIIESLVQYEDTKLLNSLTNEFRYHNNNIKQVISDLWNPISTLFKCQGIFYKDTNWDFTMNEPLDRRCIQEINRLYKDNKEPIIYTDSLASEGFKFTEIFPYSGMLRITISEKSEKYLYLFRYEKVKNVRWAGDPNNNVALSNNDIKSIGPRRSFEVWTENVKNHSEIWSIFEISCSNILRDAIIRFDVDSNKANYLSKASYLNKKNNVELAILRKTEELESQHLKLIQEIEHQDEVIDILQFAKIMSEFMIISQNDLFLDLGKELNLPIKNFNELKSVLTNTDQNSDINSIIDKHLNIANQMVDTINRLVDLTKYNESEKLKSNLHNEIISLREDISKKIIDINNKI